MPVVPEPRSEVVFYSFYGEVIRVFTTPSRVKAEPGFGNAGNSNGMACAWD